MALLNFQYYNWWVKKGCILADEMGLGKTVQVSGSGVHAHEQKLMSLYGIKIISFLSILYRIENCKPFLVVVSLLTVLMFGISLKVDAQVPNSTLQNWQREFTRWAPDDIRVVPSVCRLLSRQDVH